MSSSNAVQDDLKASLEVGGHLVFPLYSASDECADPPHPKRRLKQVTRGYGLCEELAAALSGGANPVMVAMGAGLDSTYGTRCSANGLH